jgi:hypothetical protein
VVDLGHGVERDAELALHESRGGLLVFRDAVVGVAAVLGLVDLGLQDGPDVLGGGLVVLADAEINQ